MNLPNWLLLAFHTLAAFAASLHALLYKNDPRAAFGWIGVCLVFPLGGPVLYFLFGINRVQTRAKKLQRPFQLPFHFAYERPETMAPARSFEAGDRKDSEVFARIADTVTGKPILAGNDLELLLNGEQAYPKMLAAIDNAWKNVMLATYIFETNNTGRLFIDALARAVQRGVNVRVMVDGIGERYSFPRASSLFKEQGINHVRFLPPRLFPPALHINLRNHRKILITDSRIAFTGGMNIGDRHLAANLDNPSRVVDVHFQMQGPICRQIEAAFLEDWQFCTGEAVPLPTAPPAGEQGSALCRVITDGPNEDLGRLASILIAAVSAARSRVMIMTPYFLPSRDMIAALQAAALRGVAVTIILPAKNNLPYVNWASRNMLWELLQWDIGVYYQPPPFVHSKLFVVDDCYAQIGSANIDPRSLRLNFELAVEIYDRAFVQELATHCIKAQGKARQVTLAEIDDRSLPLRTRDALAWLFSPYL